VILEVDGLGVGVGGDEMKWGDEPADPPIVCAKWKEGRRTRVEWATCSARTRTLCPCVSRHSDSPQGEMD